MNTNAYQRFVEYAELDQKIDRLTQEHSDLSKKIEQNSFKHTALVDGNRATCNKAHSLKKEMDFLELELQTLSQTLAHKEKLLHTTGSVKEYSALQHEVESLGMQRLALEDKGLTLLTRWEDAQKVCDRVLSHEPIEVNVLQEEREELVKRADYVNTLKNAYIAQKNTDEKSIDEELLAFYRSMKEKVANPAVPLINGQCSACFYSVNPKDASDIMYGNLARCKDCYRFLYAHQPVKKNDT